MRTAVQIEDILTEKRGTCNWVSFRLDVLCLILSICVSFEFFFNKQQLFEQLWKTKKILLPNKLKWYVISNKQAIINDSLMIITSSIIFVDLFLFLFAFYECKPTSSCAQGVWNIWAKWETKWVNESAKERKKKKFSLLFFSFLVWRIDQRYHQVIFSREIQCLSNARNRSIMVISKLWYDADK